MVISIIMAEEDDRFMVRIGSRAKTGVPLAIASMTIQQLVDAQENGWRVRISALCPQTTAFRKAIASLSIGSSTIIEG